MEQKQAVVAEVAAQAAQSSAAVAAEYAGLNVAEMTRLRNSAKAAGVYLKVVRNTLARRALEGTDFDCMRDGLKGPLLLAFSREEPGASARVIRDFARDNDNLAVKLVALNGELLAPAEIDKLANLPSQEQARAMLLGVMQAPLGKLLRVLAEPEAKLARLLAARGEQQESG